NGPLRVAGSLLEDIPNWHGPWYDTELRVDGSIASAVSIDRGQLSGTGTIQQTLSVVNADIYSNSKLQVNGHFVSRPAALGPMTTSEGSVSRLKSGELSVSGQSTVNDVLYLYNGAV